MVPDGSCPDPVADVFATTVAASRATSAQLEPSYTRIRFVVFRKNKSPAVRASPSLSSVGSDAFAPKYTSSKLSAANSAAACAVSAAVLAVSADVALVAAPLALVAELVADVAAAVADVDALLA